MSNIPRITGYSPEMPPYNWKTGAGTPCRNGYAYNSHIGKEISYADAILIAKEELKILAKWAGKNPYKETGKFEKRQFKKDYKFVINNFAWAFNKLTDEIVADLA